MVLPDPDRQVLRHLDYFNQLTTGCIRRLVFHESKSRTSCDRVLKRLTRDGYIRPIQRPHKGGSQGGSGEVIWALGREGWKMCERPGRFNTTLAINYHDLTTAGVFVKLIEDDRAGKYRLAGFTPEPEAWQTIQGVELQPDLMIELERPTGSMSAFLEIDMGTQRQTRINEKLTRYRKAYGLATEADLPVLPRVVFVAHNEERRKELTWVIERFGNEDRYFYTATADGFPDDMI